MADTPEFKSLPPTFDYVSGTAVDRLIQTSLTNFSTELSPLLRDTSEFTIKRGAEITASLKEIAKSSPEVEEAMNNLKTAVVLEIKGKSEDSPEKIHDRAILLLEDTQGRRASVTVALHGTAAGIQPEPGEEFNPLIHKGNFGGMGIYGQKYGELPPIIDALTHAEDLSATMDVKANSCGFSHLAGSKTVITNLHTIGDETESWLNSSAMQYATGMVFSRIGPKPFSGIITGSDAKQTQETIDRMGQASRLADPRSYNIVGTTMYGFTGTAGFVEHSMKGSYDALQQAAPESLPPLSNAKIAVQGLGKIGSATLEMYLKAGGKEAYVADVLLDNGIGNTNGDTERVKHALESKLHTFQQQYPGCKITVIPSDNIWNQNVDIVAPCSTQERIIDKSTVDLLGRNGVKVILSGANNPLENPDIADYALNEYGIAILPEVVSNNGSAITAGMEPRLLYELDRGRHATREECLQAILVPQILTTAHTNVERLLQEYARINSGRSRDQRLSLYTIGSSIF